MHAPMRRPHLPAGLAILARSCPEPCHGSRCGGGRGECTAKLSVLLAIRADDECQFALQVSQLPSSSLEAPSLKVFAHDWRNPSRSSERVPRNDPLGNLYCQNAHGRHAANLN